MSKRLTYLESQFAPSMGTGIIRTALSCDPTGGKYTRWILLQIQADHVRLPEDAEKIQDTLGKFRELSRKPGWRGPKDLYKFKRYGSLARALVENANTKTRRETVEARAMEGAKLLYDVQWGDGVRRTIYEVTTPEAGIALGWRNTEWCVKDPKYFDDYGPPFYCYLEDGEPCMLAHTDGDIRNAFDEVVRNRHTPFHFHFDEKETPWLALCVALSKIPPIRLPGTQIERSEDLEPTLMRDPWIAYQYAYEIIKGAWPEAEGIISTHAGAAASYATHVLGRRWPEAEGIIATKASWASYYARFVIKGAWPMAEAVIAADTNSAYEYARHVLKRRWIPGEAAMRRNPVLWAEYIVHLP